MIFIAVTCEQECRAVDSCPSETTVLFQWTATLTPLWLLIWEQSTNWLQKKKTKTNYHPGFLCLVTRTKFYGRKISRSALRVLRVFKKGFSSIAQIYICTFIFRFTAIYRALSIHWLEGGQSPGCVWLSKCWATTVTWQLVTNDKEKKRFCVPSSPGHRIFLTRPVNLISTEIDFHTFCWQLTFLLRINSSPSGQMVRFRLL